MRGYLLYEFTNAEGENFPNEIIRHEDYLMSRKVLDKNNKAKDQPSCSYTTLPKHKRKTSELLIYTEFDSPRKLRKLNK